MKTDTDFVALLGTKGGPAIRPGSTNPTSSLLAMDGRLYVIDCGLGVTRGLVEQGMELKSLATIFITHLHSDHYLELGPLIHTAWTAGLKTSVTIYGPPGIETYWEAFLVSMRADIDLRIEDEGRPHLADLVSIRHLDEGEICIDGPVTVSAIRTDHPPLVDCFALRFSGSRNIAVFSGDTAPLPALSGFAQNADILVHEAMLETALEALCARIGNGDDRLMKHLMRSHSPAAAAARTAAEAGVKALALNHLIPSDDPAYGETQWLETVRPHWNGTFHLGHDGMRIDLD